MRSCRAIFSSALTCSSGRSDGEISKTKKMNAFAIKAGEIHALRAEACRADGPVDSRVFGVGDSHSPPEPRTSRFKAIGSREFTRIGPFVFWAAGVLEESDIFHFPRIEVASP